MKDNLLLMGFFIFVVAMLLSLVSAWLGVIWWKHKQGKSAKWEVKRQPSGAIRIKQPDAFDECEMSNTTPPPH